MSFSASSTLLELLRVDYVEEIFYWPPELPEKVGKGKYGEVFRALCTTKPTSAYLNTPTLVPDMTYAVKRMPLSLFLDANSSSSSSSRTRTCDRSRDGGKPKLTKGQILLDELKTYPRLTSPYCVKFFDAFRDPDSKPLQEQFVYLVLEYIEGVNLLKYCLTLGRLSQEETRLITKQLLYALESLHRHESYHRDVKLQNIMVVDGLNAGVDCDFQIKLIDFGFAMYVPRSRKRLAAQASSYGGKKSQLLQSHPNSERLTSGSTSTTSTSTPFSSPLIESRPIGTLFYLAPDILRRKLHSRHTSDYVERVVLQAGDIYAVGVCVFAMLQNKMLYPEHTSEMDLLILKEQEFIPISKDFQRVYPDAAEFIRSTMRRDPRSRWSVQECLDFPWLKNFPLVRLRSPYAPEKPRHSHSTRTATATTTTTAAGASSSSSMSNSGFPPSETMPTTSNFSVSATTSAGGNLHTAMVNSNISCTRNRVVLKVGKRSSRGPDGYVPSSSYYSSSSIDPRAVTESCCPKWVRVPPFIDPLTSPSPAPIIAVETVVLAAAVNKPTGTTTTTTTNAAPASRECGMSTAGRSESPQLLVQDTTTTMDFTNSSFNTTSTTN